MANAFAKMYFAVKLITPRVGEAKARTSAVAATSGPTRSAMEYAAAAPSGKAAQLVIGGAPKYFVHGVAGHLVAVVHHFPDKDAAKCRTLAEAEQLMKKAHKKWLADAYEWFVFPAHFEAGGAGKKTPAKSKKPAAK